MDIHFRKRGKTIIAEIGGDIDHRYSEEIRRLTLSIAAPSKEADRILAISGIYRIIHSYKTVEDAVLGINQEVHKNEK